MAGTTLQLAKTGATAIKPQVLQATGSKTAFRLVKILDRFVSQGRQAEERKADVAENKAIAQIEELFGMFLSVAHKYPAVAMDKLYSHWADVLGRAPFSSADICLFSAFRLAAFQGKLGFSYTTGMFLSALINTSPDSDFAINLFQLDTELDNVGFCNTKNVTINGNVGRYAFVKMKRGTVIINGDAGEYLGNEIERGSITVNGDLVQLFPFLSADMVFSQGGDIFQNYKGAHRHLMKGGEIIAEPIE